MWLFNAESRQTAEHYTRIIEHLRCLRLNFEFPFLILNPQIRKRACKNLAHHANFLFHTTPFHNAKEDQTAKRLR